MADFIEKEIPRDLVKHEIMESKTWANKNLINGGCLIALLERYKPWDALCYLVITTQGLYPCKDWNFVYGLSSTRLGIGALSTMKF